MALVCSASEESVLVLSAEKRQTTNGQPSTNTDCMGVFSKTHHIVDFQLHLSGEVKILQRQWNEQPLNCAASCSKCLGEVP